MHRDHVGKSLEISPIKRKEMGDFMHFKYRCEMGIMYLHSAYLMRKEKPVPHAIDPLILWQQLHRLFYRLNLQFCLIDG